MKNGRSNFLLTMIYCSIAIGLSSPTFAQDVSSWRWPIWGEFWTSTKPVDGKDGVYISAPRVKYEGTWVRITPDPKTLEYTCDQLGLKYSYHLTYDQQVPRDVVLIEQPALTKTKAGFVKANTRTWVSSIVCFGDTKHLQ